MAEGVHYDVLVVGAGIIGLSSAHHIKKSNPDLSVLVVDRNASAACGWIANPRILSTPARTATSPICRMKGSLTEMGFCLEITRDGRRPNI